MTSHHELSRRYSLNEMLRAASYVMIHNRSMQNLYRRSKWFRSLYKTLREYHNIEIEFHPNEMGYPIMARKDFNHEFVTIRIRDSERKKFNDAVNGYKGTVESLVEDIVSREVKLSVSWVDGSNSFVVSCTGSKESANSGCTFTSWSDTMLEALFMAWYKLEFVIGGRVWVDCNQTDANWG